MKILKSIIIPNITMLIHFHKYYMLLFVIILYHYIMLNGICKKDTFLAFLISSGLYYLFNKNVLDFY